MILWVGYDYWSSDSVDVADSGVAISYNESPVLSDTFPSKQLQSISRLLLTHLYSMKTIFLNKEYRRISTYLHQKLDNVTCNLLDLLL